MRYRLRRRIDPKNRIGKFVSGTIDRADPGGRFRRPISAFRNFIVDPPPRSAELVFDGWVYSYPEVRFRYRAGSAVYESWIVLEGLTPEAVRRIRPELLHRVFASIGLALAPYYFRLTDYAAVRIDCSDIPEEAFSFFERYFQHGLAEFRYRRGLNPIRPIRVYSSEPCNSGRPFPVAGDGVLMLNGGGKDTVVMAELLKSTGLRLGWCVINSSPAHQKVSDISGVKDVVSLRFARDKTVTKAARYRAGHIPYSGVYMWMGLLAGLAQGFRYVTTGNEYSASFGNLQFKGVDVNHQHTKSFEYEREFASLIENNYATGIQSFSALRPFHDIGLAAMASRLSAYFGAFSSCNRAKEWCGQCEKCAWTYLALAAFLEDDVLVEIFGTDFLQGANTRRHLLQLAAGAIKPWECVGTQEETRLALSLYLARRPTIDFPRYPRRIDLERVCGEFDAVQAGHDYLQSVHTPHLIPDKLWSHIEAQAETLRPQIDI
jgi:hypothetical protein